MRGWSHVGAALLCWTVLAHPVRVLDGDTFEAALETHVVAIPGSDQPRLEPERVRLLDVDAPERGQEGYEEARRFVEQWLGKQPFTLRYCRRDAFGRILGRAQRNGEDLSMALAAKGLARMSEGRKE